MGLADLGTAIIAFVRAHHEWAPVVMFALAFAESLAFISLLVPAWGILVALGALVTGNGLGFFGIWIGASLGAAAGDWLSYWIGEKFHLRVQHVWPLSRHPELVPRGEAFVRRYGIAAIFIGRFFGPLRAAVPLAAGIFEMPFWPFQIANVLSAFLWAGVLIAFGDVMAKGLTWLWAML